MEKKNTGIIVLVVALIILVLGLGGFIIYDKVINNNEITTNQDNDNEEIGSDEKTKAFDYQSIEGLYNYTSELMYDSTGEQYNARYDLYLYENGTFNYRLTQFDNFGYMGNYTIVDNQIILNYLFETFNSPDIDVALGTHTLIINDDGTIEDPDQPIEGINLTSVTLSKATLDEEKQFLQYDDFNEIIEDAPISNNFDYCD